MTKEDVENTKAAFHMVRVGGPKEKRIRRVELMGEHTPKSLNWVKVTQLDTLKLLSTARLREVFEGVADVGDVYRPMKGETEEPHNFALVGFFSHLSVDPALDRFNGQSIDDIVVQVEAAKPWFTGLYPKERLIGGSR